MTKFGTGLSIAILIALGGVGFLISKSSQFVTQKPLVTNFEECAKAGYPIMESYPAQCRSASGELFVQIIENLNTITEPTVSGGCFVGGCSGEICSDQKDVASNCIYKEEYSCYKTASCAREINGQCGWTQTPQLLACISSKTGQARIASGYIAGHVTIGPFCPVEKEGEPCKVPPEAYTSREAVIYTSNGTTVKERVNLDKEGDYKIALAPGNYFVQIQPAGIGPGEKKQATVKSFETTTLNFDIDTGIR